MEFAWLGLSFGFPEIRQGELTRTGKKKSEQHDPELERVSRAIESFAAADRRSDRDGHREQHKCARRSKKDPGDEAKTAAKFGDGGRESPKLRQERKADEPIESAAESPPESDASGQLREPMHEHKHQPKADAQNEQPAIKSIFETQRHRVFNTILFALSHSASRKAAVAQGSVVAYHGGSR
jgi:hypothetical protein